LNIVRISFVNGQQLELRLDPDFTFQVLDSISRREVNTVSVGPSDAPQVLFAVDKVTHVSVAPVPEEEENNVS
jgi:hypothetical protein